MAPSDPPAARSITGRKRRMTTSWQVKAADRISYLVITLGGMGTIVAVSCVALVLVWVVIPLFLPARLAPRGNSSAPWDSSVTPVHLAVDEFGILGWALLPSGELVSFKLDDGQVLDRQPVAEGAELTAASCSVGSDSVALGFADGSVRLGRIGFRTVFPELSSLPPEAQQIAPDQQLVVQKGVLALTPQGQLRLQQLMVEMQDPIPAASAAIVLIDHVQLARGPVFAVLTSDGHLAIATIQERTNLLTGAVVRKAVGADIPYEPRPVGDPRFLIVSAQGDNVFLAWEDGILRRYDTRSLDKIRLAEEVRIVESPGARLTTLQPLLGRSTLIAGDSTGMTAAWFRYRPEEPTTSDGTRLVAAHRLPGGGAVCSLGMSARNRTVAVGYADGTLRVFHVTTDQLMVAAATGAPQPVRRMVIGPKEDLVLAEAGGQLWQFDFDPSHPDITLGSLFRPVWYEGYAQPEAVWQSGGGTADLEAKLGLWPLVFGTLKATFYSMLFGAPLALLAAIYTSEFLSPRWRARVKPVIELMASLPSVVLGFIAALIFAPIVDQLVPVVIATCITLPLALALGAQLWQLLSYTLLLKIERTRLLFVLLVVPLGLGSAFVLGPYLERWFFAGDLKAWLDGQVGSAVGGWMLTLLPLSALGIALVNAWVVQPRVRQWTSGWMRPAVARLSAVRFLVSAVAAFLLAWLLSGGLSVAGFDARGTYIDTYVQRNALIVGFVMGFAIIPIIYTIADDALSTVPQHLRSGSLAAGATPWQTAVWIVIPTAMSGLFSALMIGLGRAVGETMIVLMAAGNTPVLSWNIFVGFRTLSANIAVELPEAAKDTTHYRTLFLAALTLFILTFLVNTVAELVRLRFRRRAYQL